MGFPKVFFTFFLLFLPIFNLPVNGQIVFRSLQNYEINIDDSLFFDITSTRRIVPLNGEWFVYPSESEEKNKTSVEVPSIFQGTGDLIFERNFTITPFQAANNRIQLFFLGLNYSADISINNIIIYRHTGGDFPFNLEVPRDILHTDRENLLSVKLFYELDSENTIPVKQRFLFPKDFGGIFRDVYLHLTPNISISDLAVSSSFIPKNRNAAINITAKVENLEFKQSVDTLMPENEFNLEISLMFADGSDQQVIANEEFELQRNKEIIINKTSNLSNPVLWSPENPLSYLVRLELWRGEELIDVTKYSLSVYSLVSDKDSLLLNNNKFNFNGVTYIPSFDNFGELAAYSKMENDIRLIKQTGFNSIRFIKNIPHPYYLKLCEEYGLLAFIELPINYIPASLANDNNFTARSRSYLLNLLKEFKKYPAVAAVGVGSSYVPEFDSHIALIKSLAQITKQNITALTYASFAGYEIPEIEELDLYGIELFNTSVVEDSSNITSLQKELGKANVFISEATYVVNRGSTDGYVNEHSFEAQAKYVDDLLDYSSKHSLAGYFINTMFDYKGEFSSLFNGFSEDNIYYLGLSPKDRSTSRLGYKIVFSKLHETERVTIPIGSRKDDSPIEFIVFGLLLALIMGVLVNSGKKFREDTSRALLRPYNFYADIRDQRIISGYHTTILAVVIAAVTALLVSNILFYLREKIVFEKLLLSFGSHDLIKLVNYLAWNPLSSLLWLSIIFFALLILLTIVVKTASFFVRNKVFLSNSYFIVIWSFLPFVLLIPVGIILYRLLIADVGNLYIYIGIIIFCVWVFYRLMKGIYVIYDVNPGGVYFYSIIIVLLITAFFLIYFEIKNSAIDYLLLTLRHYKIIG